MIDINVYIQSGILEQYILGELDEERAQEVMQNIATYSELEQAYQATQLALENYAQAHAIQPPKSLKQDFIDSADGLFRKKKRMLPTPDQTILPELDENASLEEWASIVKKIPAPLDLLDTHVEKLGRDSNKKSYLVWVKERVEEEVHTDLHETFFILEGSCTCYIGDTITEMNTGDFMSIPLFQPHHIVVTSDIPIKFVVQKRKAA